MPDQAHRSPEQLQARLEFETLIPDTSTSIQAAPLERAEAAVERALARVRELVQAGQG